MGNDKVRQFLTSFVPEGGGTWLPMRNRTHPLLDTGGPRDTVVPSPGGKPDLFKQTGDAIAQRTAYVDSLLHKKDK